MRGSCGESVVLRPSWLPCGARHSVVVLLNSPLNEKDIVDNIGVTVQPGWLVAEACKRLGPATLSSSVSEP